MVVFVLMDHMKHMAIITVYTIKLTTYYKADQYTKLYNQQIQHMVTIRLNAYPRPLAQLTCKFNERTPTTN